MPFTDRVDAGRRLAKALAAYRDAEPVVLALPRGGVVVAAQIAAVLWAPLDLILVRKIGAPGHAELAMGAVVDGANPIVVRNQEVIDALRVSEAAFDEICLQEINEIERRRHKYLGKRKSIDVTDRTVIVVDDGIATGATTRAALRAVRERQPKSLVLAVPVAPADMLGEMRREVDDLICLESYDFFGAIGAYYTDFRQVGDEEVIALLEASRSAEAGTGEHPDASDLS